MKIDINKWAKRTGGGYTKIEDAYAAIAALYEKEQEIGEREALTCVLIQKHGDTYLVLSNFNPETGLDDKRQWLAERSITEYTVRKDEIIRVRTELDWPNMLLIRELEEGVVARKLPGDIFTSLVNLSREKKLEDIK